jgi:hypothetical protein
VNIIAAAVVGMAMFFVACIYVLVIEHLHNEKQQKIIEKR